MIQAALPNLLPWCALSDAHVVVVGLGKSGLSAARYLISQGAKVTLWDTRTDANCLADIAIPKSANATHGPQTDAFWESVNALVLSPGISPRSEALNAAYSSDIPVIGDMELFALALSRQNKPPKLIGITGSNGKTTCTLLVEHILQHAGYAAAAVGNVGRPALDALNDNLDLMILELSSFQLETLFSLHLDVACYLNLSDDHLDRHGDMRAYGAAKQRIYEGAQHAVYWREQALTKPSIKVDKHTTFGLDFTQDDWSFNAKGWVCLENRPLIHESAIPLAGLHNVLNVMACAAIAHCVGVEPTTISDAIAGFKAPAHRCVTISRQGNVQWIDDSKATNPGATLAALNGIGPLVTGRLFLIAGGRGKGANFAVLADALKQHVFMLIAIGEDGHQLMDLHNNAHYASSLQSAVKLAATQATENDAVLLSPACASLDMFTDYEHRADVFKQAIVGLAV